MLTRWSTTLLLVRLLRAIVGVDGISVVDATGIVGHCRQVRRWNLRGRAMKDPSRSIWREAVGGRRLIVCSVRIPGERELMGFSAGVAWLVKRYVLDIAA